MSGWRIILLGLAPNAALTLIASRACSITRGTGAAVALAEERGMTCRALAGRNVPRIGSEVDTSSGFSGECIRVGRPLRCDDAASDPRANADACHLLQIRSILSIFHQKSFTIFLNFARTRSVLLFQELYSVLPCQPPLVELILEANF